jgi:hypothetical protein
MFRMHFILVFVAAVVATLAACASQGKLRDVELGRIGDWLPGEYDNAAQVEADLLAAADPVHESLRMNLVPVSAPFLGKSVLYVEMLDAGSGRVLSAQLYRFEKSADDKGIVQRTFDFKEPQRWAGGLGRADIFKSLLPDDVTATTACDLAWIFDGEWFTGVAGRKGCPIRRMEFDGLELKIEQAGRAAGDLYLFRRTGAEA